MTIASYVLIEPYTGKYYFGSSANVEVRIDRHFRELRNGQHHCVPLQELWDQFRHLETIIYPAETREEAYGWEEAYLEVNRYDDRLLNVGMGVRGGDNLTRNPHRRAIIEKISESLQVRMKELTAQERLDRYSKPGSLNGMYGRTHSEAVKQASRERFLNNPPTGGGPPSAEARARISYLASLRTGDRNSFYGKRHSDVTKAKLSERMKGNLPTNAMTVEVNGRVYTSIRAACDGENLSYPTMAKRIASTDPEYAGYKYRS